MVQFVNGYIFHIGLAVVFFLFTPHILLIKSLTGLSWPGLPNNLIMMVGVITAASLLVALAFRLTSPVLRLISRADDYISWLMTFLPVATGWRPPRISGCATRRCWPCTCSAFAPSSSGSRSAS